MKLTPDRLTDNRDTGNPRAPLVGHVPVSVARPPASEYADKADLIDARIQSSSSENDIKLLSRTPFKLMSANARTIGAVANS